MVVAKAAISGIAVWLNQAIKPISKAKWERKRMKRVLEFAGVNGQNRITLELQDA